jgi:hypothetical protein
MEVPSPNLGPQTGCNEVHCGLPPSFQPASQPALGQCPNCFRFPSKHSKVKMCPCASHEGVRGHRCVAPFILDQGSSGRYTAVESTSGDPGTLSGPQHRSKQNGQKNLLPLLGIVPRTLQPSLLATSHCHLLHHKSHTDWSGIEPASAITKSVTYERKTLLVTESLNNYLYGRPPPPVTCPRPNTVCFKQSTHCRLLSMSIQTR